MKPTHTPIPWGMEITADTTWIGQLRSDGKKLFTITAQCDGGHSDGYIESAHATKIANAEFIVRAVNNHESLLDALKRARHWIDNCGAQGGTQSALNDIDAARAKANT